jgi:hypothetical protein
MLGHRPLVNSQKGRGPRENRPSEAIQLARLMRSGDLTPAMSPRLKMRPSVT